MKKSYSIEVDCAACANKMEAAAAKVNGVKSCVVNFMMQKMTVEFRNAVMKDVVHNCKKVESDCEIYL